MSDAARTGGNELLAANCMVMYDVLWGDGQDLNAHIGIKRPLTKIQGDLDPNDPERMGPASKRIEGML